jgi:hypothetical protein
VSRGVNRRFVLLRAVQHRGAAEQRSEPDADAARRALRGATRPFDMRSCVRSCRVRVVFGFVGVIIVFVSAAVHVLGG